MQKNLIKKALSIAWVAICKLYNAISHNEFLIRSKLWSGPAALHSHEKYYTTRIAIQLVAAFNNL